MEIAQSVQKELAKRDEIILALEMLVVDQASRLLALEAVMSNLQQVQNISFRNVNDYIEEESSRYKKYMQGEGLSGFIERANRVACEFLDKTK